MNSRYDWSVGIGRWMDVPIRLHVLLLLGLVGVFAIDWHYRAFTLAMGTGIITALVVVFSIVCHELSHVWVGLNLGGMVHSMTLAPWGGMSQIDPPTRPWERILIQLAGPFTNGMFFVIGAILLVGSGHETLSSLTNPFSPHAFSAVEWEVSTVAIVTWVNFQLFVFNLLPCYPLDGLKILRELFSATNPHASGPKIEATLMAIGQLVAATMIVMAVVLRNFNDGPVQPVWSLLLGVGITMIFAARYEYRQQLRELFRQGDWDVDDEAGGTHEIPFDDSNSGWLQENQYSQWLSEKQLEYDFGSALETELADFASDEQLADEILEKLHHQGIGSLSHHERQFLEQFSRRIRDKRSEV